MGAMPTPFIFAGFLLTELGLAAAFAAYTMPTLLCVLVGVCASKKLRARKA